MLLTILIPTYNRASDLDYNLNLLEQFIVNESLANHVCVLISNNCSSDDTKNVVSNHVSNNKIHINYYEQITNIGLEQNALFVLKKAETEYVMFLGDDDYVQEGYLSRVVLELKQHPALGCIIPSNKGILSDKSEILGSGREIDTSSTYYTAGFDACLANSWRGHQISGIVLQREGLYEEYIQCGVHNLYPFIFFVSYIALKKDVLHLTDYPILVTRVPQTKKNWNYGQNGLLTDIFNNYRYLNVTKKQRGLLERNIIVKNEWRYLQYKDQPYINKAIENVVFNINTSFDGKVFISEHTICNKQYSGYKLRMFLFIVYTLVKIKRIFK